MTPLVEVLGALRAECRAKVGVNAGFSVHEVERIGELLVQCQAEAVRLEAVELQVRALAIADEAGRLVDDTPRGVDLDAFERDILSARIYEFPRGGRAGVRPS